MKTKLFMIVALVGMYLLGTWFTMLSFDVTQWSEEGRFSWFTLLCTLILIGAIAPKGIIFKDD